MTAKMLLHWSPRSPFVRKVMIVAHEAGVADRIETVRTVVAPSEPNVELMKENPQSHDTSPHSSWPDAAPNARQLQKSRGWNVDRQACELCRGA